MRIRFSLDPLHDLVLLVDRVQVQQALVNLFRNALEAMAQSAREGLVAWLSNKMMARDYNISPLPSRFIGPM